ncbi:MAG: STELLO glycosyltransferase family protein [Bryobacteraceae bacterium]
MAQGASDRDIPFYLIGDAASPADFHLDGCNFFGLERQRETGLRFAGRCPLRHYARKNIGYLLAIRDGARIVIETDDDNLPRCGFWSERTLQHTAPVLRGNRWVNVYRWFTDEPVWPRGFPLEHLRDELGESMMQSVTAPIQQGLAAANPDVDAVYRFVGKLPVEFERDAPVALARGSWCAFNSQNTTWFADAFPLLYLPSYCTFRMTDIWRSFIAQRIAWANGWSVLYHGPTVDQVRNDHDLLRDFRDEIPGYLNNARLAETLDALSLRSGPENLGDNLLTCYEQLVRLELVDRAELQLLDLWLGDLKA